MPEFTIKRVRKKGSGHFYVLVGKMSGFAGIFGRFTTRRKAEAARRKLRGY
jgi:hypothetical protein